ncbi:RibD family protein [Rubrobacter marinus]|nr:dihydrofolate reductase family protein [Rubrobacter marinus]
MAAEDVYSGLTFPTSGVEGARPYVAINMVSTLDGKAAVGGKASPIGSAVDRQIMRNIRAAFDAVVVGAGTVRTEEMNLSVTDELAERRKSAARPGQPLGVVLAGAGELPLGRKVFRRQGQQTVVVISGGATPEKTLAEAEEAGVRVLRTETPSLPKPHDVLAVLRDRLGVRNVLLEGGPGVNGSFLSSGVVDELFLTLSPKIAMPRGAFAIAEARTAGHSRAMDFHPISVHCATEEGELYLRYQKRPRSPRA